MNSTNIKLNYFNFKDFNSKNTDFEDVTKQIPEALNIQNSII